jgi:hypothetical protein
MINNFFLKIQIPLPTAEKKTKLFGAHISKKTIVNDENLFYSKIGLFSGDRPEGSKRNLKFQSAMWHPSFQTLSK